MDNLAVKLDSASCPPRRVANESKKGGSDVLKRLDPYDLGEALIEGSWDSCDLEQAMSVVFARKSPVTIRGIIRALSYIARVNIFNLQSLERAFHVGEKHYDLGNELFSEMLGSSMTYTCGLWSGAQSLEEAQVNKLERICRKLELGAGMNVLDIGCGWGNFAFYAAKRYGVNVTGYTVSKEQAAFARQHCQGLPVKIIVDDFRNITGKFDAVVSIEMIEAVGAKNLAEYFRIIRNSLKDSQSKFMLEAISCDIFSYRSDWGINQYFLWLIRHIFPNGFIPSLRQLTSVEGLLINDLLNFGPDYELTLQAWLNNFKIAWPKFSKDYGQEFGRAWEYYLVGCAVLFKMRKVQLYQILYSKN